MASTHIRISEEAKERLERRKHDDESFTDVVMRLTDRDLLAGFGVMEGTDGFREAVEGTRDELDADLRSRTNR